MENHGPSIGSLVLVSILAFVVPLLINRIKRVRIPIAAGEILAGVIVGKSGLDLIHMDPLLQVFHFLGLASLMFLSGMEIDLGALMGSGKRPTGRPAWLARLHHPLIVGALIFGLTLSGAFWFAGKLHAWGLVTDPLFPAMIVATCGLTIIMPVLKDRNLLSEPFGQTLFHTAVLGDIVPLLGLSVLVALKVKGSAIESLWILALVAAGAAVFLLARRLQRYNLLEGLTHGTAQISVRAAFALMFIFLALAESMGIEAILGAFVAGLLLAALSGHEREEIAHKLDALGFGFLIPVFFLMVGVEFDLLALLRDRDALLLVPLLLGGTLLVKAVPALLLAIWYPVRTTLAGMLLLTTQMSVTIAASAIAHKAGAYGPSVHASVVLVAILTAMIGPVAFDKVLGELAGAAHRTGVVIAGMNRLSLLLGGRLLSRGIRVTAVDQHEERVQEFTAAGIPAVLGDPTARESLGAVQAETAGTLVAITQNEAGNLEAARAGRSQFGIPRVILFARSKTVLTQAQDEGFEVVNPDLAEVSLVESLLYSPAAGKLLTGGDEDLQLADFLVTGGPLAGLPLRSARLPAEVLVVSVLRGREKIVPHGDTVLQVGDLLTVVGPPAAREPMQRLVSGT